jgi:Flp pilus assembly pilin Flp
MDRGQRHGRERGQGLTEYALVILFIALVVFGALVLLGPVLGSIFSNIKPAL